MAEIEHARIEVAFEGGQIIGGLVTAASAAALEDALGKGAAGTATLETAEGDMVAVVVGKVVYVKRFSRESRIGF